MVSEVRLWHGKMKVCIISKLEGHALVEALEGYKAIKKGERFLTRLHNLERIVKEASHE